MQDMTHCKEAFGCDSHFSDERALKCVDFIIEKPSYLIHNDECETQTKGRVLERVEFSDRFVCSFDSRESRVMNRRLMSRH